MEKEISYDSYLQRTISENLALRQENRELREKLRMVASHTIGLLSKIEAEDALKRKGE
jgi:hypothetical protein